MNVDSDYDDDEGAKSKDTVMQSECPLTRARISSVETRVTIKKRDTNSLSRHKREDGDADAK